MWKLWFYTTLVILNNRVVAEDLRGFGLHDATILDDTEASAIRGQGGYLRPSLEAQVTSVNTNLLAFSIVDKESGSIFNLNATQQLRGQDSVSGPASSIDSGLQSLGILNSGGVQFGDATFSLGDFSFGHSGVAAYGQSTQLAGPSNQLNFNSLLK